MRKQRRLRSVSAIRGGNSVYDRVPFRRMSIEIPEALWARLKQVGLDTQTPISRLLCDAAQEKHGKATEAEVVALYRAMGGMPEPVAPTPKHLPNNFLGSFSVDTSAPVPTHVSTLVTTPVHTQKTKHSTVENEQDQSVKTGLKKSANILKQPKKT